MNSKTEKTFKKFSKVSSVEYLLLVFSYFYEHLQHFYTGVTAPCPSPRGTVVIVPLCMLQHGRSRTSDDLTAKSRPSTAVTGKETLKLVEKCATL